MDTNVPQLEILEPMDTESLNAISNEMETEQLPPLPQNLPEYEPAEITHTQVSENDDIDYESLVPVDENEYRAYDDNIDYSSLIPYNEDTQKTKDLGVWDESKLKMDMGNITQYRAELGREVWFGKLSLDEAKSRVKGRHGEILNKYGITKAPEFSFAKFKSDPLRTILGETAQMLPFYSEGLKKGAGYSLITVPATMAVRGAQGQVAGAIAGTAVEPGGGTAAGAVGGRVGGSVFGVIEGVNTGMLLGTFHTSMDVEGMNLYLDLREKGIDDNTAKVAGLSGGLLDGLLEVASFGVMTAPVKGAAKKVAAKMLWDSMAKSPTAQRLFKNTVTYVTKEYFKRMGAEVSTEMLQDVVNNTMTLLAAQADSVESAKPTGEDWKNIVTKTGPQTAAAMALMGLFSTPFDVMNANVGSVKGGTGEIGTKAEIEQNISELSEGKAISTGELTLEGGISYDTVAEVGDYAITELESELSISDKKLSEIQKEANTLSGKSELTSDENTKLSSLRDEIKYEQDYQSLIKEEISKTSTQMSEKETAQKQQFARKQELIEKAKKENLTNEEKQELADITIDELKERETKDSTDKSSKAREKEITKNIRDLDSEIENAQRKESKTRDKRNKIETKQDDIQKKIDSLENENEEIERALKATDIETDRAEMQTMLTRNKETIKALKNNIKDLEAQRSQLNSEIDNAIKESDSLADKRALLDEERAKIKEGVVDENGKIDMTVQQYKNQRLSALKKTLRVMSSAIKNGIRLTRREIRDAQNTAISLIKNSEMPNSDKSKFLVTIRDIGSQEKLQKVLPDLIKKINGLEENANKKAALNYIGKLLKQAKPKKGGKTPIGKFNADIQKMIEDIREATTLTSEEAYGQIEKIFDFAKDRGLTDLEVDKIRMLYNFSGLSDKTSRELLPLARMLKSLIVDGKMVAELKAESKKRHREIVVDEAKKSIEGESGGVIVDRKKPNFKKVFSQFVKSLGHTSDGWDGLMHTLSQNDKTHKLENMLDVFSSKMKKIEGVITWTKKVNQSIKDVYGLKNDKQLLKKCNEDSVIEDIGTYTNQDGERITLQMSRAEARKLYMEMQDPTLNGSLKEGNKYTFRDDIENVTQVQRGISDKTLDLLFGKSNNNKFFIIDKSTQQLIEEYLTPEDKAFANWQLSFYQEYGKHTNEFYREKYGMDMPSNEFYSPIKRIIDGETGNGNWVDEAMYRLSMKPSSHKARTSIKASLKQQNDLLVLADHISENEHYMAMDRVVTDIDTVFKNNEIRDIVKSKYGDSILSIIDGFITDIKTDGIEASRTELKGFNRIRSNITAAYLGAKAQIALKQLTAIGVFAIDIPAKDFALGVVDFFANPVKAVDTLSKSYFLKDRADALSVEMRDIVRSNEFNAFAKMQGIQKQMFFFTQWGDKWSIFIGGWSVYRSVLKNTGDSAKAMEAFERSANRYQQSGHIDQLSAWQRSGNPIQKSLVMFTSDQMKQARAEIHSIRDAILSGKKEDILKAAKTIAICHIILPNIVQFITNGFEWDEDDQLRATILGPFNVYPIIGDILSTAVATAMKFAGREVHDFGGMDLTIFRPFAEIKESFKKLKPGDITGEDIMECLINLTKETVGPLTGVNFKYLIDISTKGPKYVDEGKILEAGKLLGGWSPYVIEKKGEPKKSDDYGEDSGEYGDDKDYKEDKE